MGQSRPELPPAVEPMLATARPAPPEGPGWSYEIKWDGVRAVVGVVPGGPVRAHSRNARDITRSYPELDGLASVVEEPVLLDGELVTLDPAGRPSFHLLQFRMHVQLPGARLLRDLPVQFYVFDLLHHAGESLLALSYLDRRARLAELALDADVVRVPPYYTDVSGADMLAVARDSGLEGVVAKRTNSLYYPGKRTQAWLKTALRNTQEVIIGGWTAGEGRRSGTLGALLLGVHDRADARLRFVGHVGTGFDRHTLADLQSRLAPLSRPTSPFDEPVPTEYARRAHWVHPTLVGEVEHRQWTADNRLRHPAWRGLRPDREPAEVEAPFFD